MPKIIQASRGPSVLGLKLKMKQRADINTAANLPSHFKQCRSPPSQNQKKKTRKGKEGIKSQDKVYSKQRFMEMATNLTSFLFEFSLLLPGSWRDWCTVASNSPEACNPMQHKTVSNHTFAVSLIGDAGKICTPISLRTRLPPRGSRRKSRSY